VSAGPTLVGSASTHRQKESLHTATPPISLNFPGWVGVEKHHRDGSAVVLEPRWPTAETEQMKVISSGSTPEKLFSDEIRKSKALCSY